MDNSKSLSITATEVLFVGLGFIGAVLVILGVTLSRPADAGLGAGLLAASFSVGILGSYNTPAIIGSIVCLLTCAVFAARGWVDMTQAAITFVFLFFLFLFLKPLLKRFFS